MALFNSAFWKALFLFTVVSTSVLFAVLLDEIKSSQKSLQVVIDSLGQSSVKTKLEHQILQSKIDSISIYLSILELKAGVLSNKRDSLRGAVKSSTSKEKSGNNPSTSLTNQKIILKDNNGIVIKTPQLFLCHWA